MKALQPQLACGIFVYRSPVLKDKKQFCTSLVKQQIKEVFSIVVMLLFPLLRFHNCANGYDNGYKQHIQQ